MRRLYVTFLALVAMITLGAAGTAMAAKNKIRTRHSQATATPTTTASITGRSTATATPTSASTATSTATATAQATAMPQATATSARGGGDATSTATPEATSTVTPVPTSTPAKSENLLANGTFAAGFDGWMMQNGYWRIHDITGSTCAASNPDWPLTMAEMDRDVCKSCNVWPVGGEDWLWQDVVAPPHTSVTLTLTEAHHMVSGQAEMRVYGSRDGTTWETVWQRLQPDAAYGAGHRCETPPSFSYTFSGDYPYYRVEVHGKINEEGDGWLLGPVSLRVQ